MIVIVSKVPERLSLFTTALRVHTARFLFFSDVTPLLDGRLAEQLKLILLDNTDGDFDVVDQVETLRRIEVYRRIAILAVIDGADLESGVAALRAGANDYLSSAYVAEELAIRARIHLSALYAEQAPSSPDTEFDAIYPLEDRQIIQSTVRHIRAHIASISTVGELALRVGYQEKAVNNAFLTHLGQTAFAYMRAYRIESAKKLLAEIRLPIAQIALEVGYSSPANFSTAFKSLVGQSPAQYRASILPG